MKQKNWKLTEINDLFNISFNDLLFQSHSIHRKNFDPNSIQLAALLNVKTGSCPENCHYCPQSAHYNTGLKKEKLMEVEPVKEAAKKAKQKGASRFCIAAAWRNLHNRDVEKIADMVRAIKNEDLESCISVGMVTEKQMRNLKDAGLDFCNHNIDTSREFYHNIITTRTYDDRLESIKNIKNAGVKICSGGIIGMGESKEDRAKMLLTLSEFHPPPLSVPINRLVPIKGTPLEKQQKIGNIDFIRTIAVARIIFPKSYVRLSAGREGMSEEMQALCFFAGANSMFYGEKLLTTPNPKENKDLAMLAELGIKSVR
ncbi:MAG: biotin synthase BioB [Rickettsiaceae bacterium H1]|nr:biotin synthase BioB [Rickettsiaceae bacterium H1]